MGLLSDKVVLVTGAGGGIGRCHALACAREGARVVVNDLGGSRAGEGANSAMADAVVREIEELGGEAVASYDSVSDPRGAERMVQLSVDTWGRLDVLVNNAGILRDRTFRRMSAGEWQAVIDVHLQGTRNTCRAALDALSVRGGAIVNTTSYSGMIGNFGQSNYAAAKAGIYGLTRVLALELRRAGIRVNALAPVAHTRMTEDIEMVDAAWRPEQVSPLVVFLGSELGEGITGRVFGVQGQRIHLYEVKTNPGVEKPGEELWTAEEIAERLEEICAWPEPRDRTQAGADRVSEVFAHLPAGFDASSAGDWAAVIQWRIDGGQDQTLRIDGGQATVRHRLEGSPTCTVHIDRDSLLAMFRGELEPTKAFMTGRARADNMGDLMKMGAAFDFGQVAAAFAAGGEAPDVPAASPAEPADAGAALEDAAAAPPPIGKRYEGGYWFVDREEYQAYAAATDDRNDSYRGEDSVAPPMYHVRPFIDLMMKLATDPELELDLLRLVHGEHDVRFHRPLRHGDLLQLRGDLQRVEDKSSGRVVTYGLYGFVDGGLALEGSTTYFIRAPASGSRPKRKKAGREPAEQPPPDLVVEQVVSEDQATRYAAASGDDNPIHVDPETARSAGLPGVILHGLCTMAFAQRDLIRELAGGDPRRLRRLAVRFARPVSPGETLRLKVWTEGERIRFTTENDRGKPVIVNGRAEID